MNGCEACKKLHSLFRDAWNQYSCAGCEADCLIAALNASEQPSHRMAFAAGTLVLDRVWYVGRSERATSAPYYVTNGTKIWAFTQTVANELDRRHLVAGAP